MASLRSLGYIIGPSRDPVAERLERAGSRLVALNRLRPRSGHRYAACPVCHRWDGLWVAPDGSWSTVCRCAPSGELDVIDLALFLRTAAA